MLAITPDSDTTSHAIRVLILEASGYLREGVEPMLRPHGDIEVVGLAQNASMAIRLAHLYPPHVVVANLEDAVDAPSVLRDLRRRIPDARVLLMLNRSDPALARTLRQAGADELLFGAQRPADLVGAVRRVGAFANAASLRRSA